MNGVFKNPVSVGPTPPWFCSVDDDTPPTKLEKDVNISKTMMAPVQGLYRMLPVNSCTYNRTTKNDKPIEFSVDGSTVRLGDRKWNLNMESQIVTLLGVDPRLRRNKSLKTTSQDFSFIVTMKAIFIFSIIPETRKFFGSWRLKQTSP